MSNLLTNLYTEIYGPIDAPGKMKNLAELAETLSNLAGRKTPWSARALNSIIMGHSGFRVTDELNQAMAILAGQIDGQNPLQAKAKPMELLVIGNVIPGSIVLGDTIRCLGCQIPFVPRVPWQKYHDHDCGKKYRKQQSQSSK